MTRTTSSPQPGDWKQKYLDNLDQQQARDQQQQQLLSLLVKALMRLSLLAEGADPQLDTQLSGLRAMLRDSGLSAATLTTALDALDGQTKRIDTVKTERGKAIAAGFRTLVGQLQQLQPEKTARQQLQQLARQLKARSQQVPHYSALLNEYAKVQAEVLSERNIRRVSKPFWHQWQPDLTADNAVVDDSAPSAPSVQEPPAAPVAASVDPPRTTQALDRDSDGLDLANEQWQVQPVAAPEGIGEEPPFSRLNGMICSILQELLQQIEPPTLAKANYDNAKKQVDKGLNWYELVPTLEDISLVVVSAFDQNQQEFEGFLSSLNDRLLAAYDYISASRQAEGNSRQARQQLHDSLRDQVSEMQQSVGSATDLEQLKNQVNARLDQIVGVMDQHQSGEQAREDNLSRQLDELVAQVKQMEAASEQAERRLEEQRQKALRDVLTQLPNREAYQLRLALEFERWQRYGRPLSMVVCDIDHFKRVNDQYGHLAGDKVLRIVAKTLITRLRKTDFVARYGGEEFVVLMPETSEQQAAAVAEGVREAIGSCPFHFKEQPLTITMSFGITGFYAGDTHEEVFARADQALYQAKDGGRNCCVVAKQNPSGQGGDSQQAG